MEALEDEGQLILRDADARIRNVKRDPVAVVGEGWTNAPLEASDELHIRRTHETGGLGFANIHEVYKPTKTGTVKAPKDMVGWFQKHPYLQTSKPEPITVGGVEGVQFEIRVENLPEDHHGVCGSDCVDLALWLIASTRY